MPSLMLEQQEKEHSLETWILFLDLVKAFDRVPRELLWDLLQCFGVSPKILNLLRAVHKDVTDKFEVEGTIQEVNCSILESNKGMSLALSYLLSLWLGS